MPKKSKLKLDLLYDHTKYNYHKFLEYEILSLIKPISIGRFFVLLNDIRIYPLDFYQKFQLIWIYSGNYLIFVQDLETIKTLFTSIKEKWHWLDRKFIKMILSPDFSTYI